MARLSLRTPSERCHRRSKRGAVVGGGLLGLEAAGALKNLGIETHVIEFAPMLMAEQLDQIIKAAGLPQNGNLAVHSRQQKHLVRRV